MSRRICAARAMAVAVSGLFTAAVLLVAWSSTPLSANSPTPVAEPDTTPAGSPASPSGSAVVQARAGALTLSGAYIPQPATPTVAAAYLTVTNHGRRADRLTGASTSVAARVVPMTESDANGVGTMTPLGEVTIPARGSFAFAPGHAHLMVEELHRHLREGDRVTMTLTFRHAGTVRLRVPVRAVTASVNDDMPGMDGTGGHD
jgi:copper(I)-binding protein